ncbi:MAG: hypothetical protein ACOYOK_01035 [Pseudobdellovibrionaceae bacterium]
MKKKLPAEPKALKKYQHLNTSSLNRGAGKKLFDAIGFQMEAEPQQSFVS